MSLDLLSLILSPQGLAAATTLVFLAGLSEGAGTRGVVLLINRITPVGFCFSLLIAALLFLLSAAVWVTGIWLAADAFFGVRVPLAQLFVLISAAYVPLLLGVLAMLPLIGTLLRSMLRLWSFLIALGALVSLGLSAWQALACAVAGSLLVAGATWLLGEPSAQQGRRAWALLTGQPRPLRRAEPPQVIPGYSTPQEAEP